MFNLRSGWEYRNIHEMLSVEDGATHTPLHRESTLSGEGRWWRGMRCNQGAEGHLLWSPWSWHGEEWLKQQPQQTERNHKSGRRNQRGRNPSKCKKRAEGKEQGSAGFPSTKIHRKQFIHRTLTVLMLFTTFLQCCCAYPEWTGLEDKATLSRFSVPQLNRYESLSVSLARDETWNETNLLSETSHLGHWEDHGIYLLLNLTET